MIHTERRESIKTYHAGIDIGSTTVKLVVLDENTEIIFGDCRCHHAHTQETLNSLLKTLKQELGDCALKVRITGSFIAQMAVLLQTDAEGLNEAAKYYQQIWPIAARCGVFAKNDTGIE